MAKKKGNVPSKAAAKAAKKAKAEAKVEKKEKKKTGKGKDGPDDDEDLEAILEKFREEWESQHKVTEEVTEGPPSRRANATLTSCPNGAHLWCIGGEYFSEDGKAYFYNDVFRYSPEKNEWRKFVSPTCPGPRSAHAVVGTPAGGGKLFLFGGEFSSLYQNSFHHYRDFWCFDIGTHSWDRIETKIRPSARSGHRMAMWKHCIFLFGGFYDPGIRTNYLNDLWYFDTHEYHWQEVQLSDDRRPSPRSGFSFLPTPEGIALHGGYVKEYAKGKRPVGVMLEDTWFLRISEPSAEALASASTSKAIPGPSFSSKKGPKKPQLVCKWEKRKKLGYAPSTRSGCTMALWANRNQGVLFGGVTDEDTGEETLESVFHNDMYAYQLLGNGRWSSVTLRKPKKKGPGQGKKQKQKLETIVQSEPLSPRGGEFEDDDESDDDTASVASPSVKSFSGSTVVGSDDLDPDDPLQTVPIPRYNTMLAVLRNTLYGGIFERGSREYTLDDFYSLPLDKLDQFVCLKPCDVIIPDGEESSSSEEDGDDDDDDDEDDDETRDGFEDDETVVGNNDEGEGEPAAKAKVVVTVENDVNVEGDGDDVIQELDSKPTEPETEESVTAIRAQAMAFMGVAKDAGKDRSAEDVLSTPLPGETLAMFYARSREYWAGKAHESSANRGKMLRRDGFSMAQEKYDSYKPILQEIEQILAEAGLDEDEIKRSASHGGGGGGESRNRR